jgi:hypothetical protein
MPEIYSAGISPLSKSMTSITTDPVDGVGAGSSDGAHADASSIKTLKQIPQPGPANVQ